MKEQLLGIRGKKNAGNQRDRWHTKGYKLTISQYNAFLKDQEFCCAICGLHEEMFRNGLSVDHDHNSGDIRGLLCTNCNTLLGHAKDRIETLISAINYLSREVCLDSLMGDIFHG